MNIDQRPHFPSFIMGGFECAYARPRDKERMDLLSATQHDARCAEDYDLLHPIGIKAVREGLSWNQIDRGNGVFDFTRFEKMMQIGQEKGVKQIWNLNHFDIPDDLDILSDEFVDRFRRYAVESARLIRHYQSGTIFIVPINEISFFTFMAGAYGNWHPFLVQHGLSFKQQLVRATIAAIQAISEIDADVRFIIVEPVMHRQAREPKQQEMQMIETMFHQEEFQTFDMISGRKHPELGGKPEYLDIIGINHYPSSQEWIVAEDPGDISSYETIPWDGADWVPLTKLLSPIQERYGRPMIISETGAWGSLRPDWWKMFLHQAERAIEKGIALHGIVAYPLIDRPDWNDGHLTNSGLWDFRAGDPSLTRIPQRETIALISNFAHAYPGR